MMIKSFLLVGLGGGIGSMLRLTANLMIKSYSFPTATFLVNIIGSFIIGIVIGLNLKSPAIIGEQSRIFFATGICGGFTTFSAFAIENIQLLKSGNYGYFFLYSAGTLVIGIFAAYLGLLAVK